MRLEEQTASLCRCEREEAFSEMYAALGNEDAHDRIRAANPGQNHCRWLADCPVACLEFPKDLASARKGGPCPNNPIEKLENQPLFQEIETKRELLREAHRIADLVMLGMLPTSLDRVTPEEFALARIVTNYRRSRDAAASAGIGLLRMVAAPPRNT